MNNCIKATVQEFEELTSFSEKYRKLIEFRSVKIPSETLESTIVNKLVYGLHNGLITARFIGIGMG